MKKSVFAIALLPDRSSASRAELNPRYPPQTAPEAAPQPVAQHPLRKLICPPPSARGILSIPRTSMFLPESATGKSKRRRAAVPALRQALMGSTEITVIIYWMNGRLGGTWDIPMLPLTRISNPFFFGFGRAALTAVSAAADSAAPARSSFGLSSRALLYWITVLATSPTLNPLPLKQACTPRKHHPRR